MTKDILTMSRFLLFISITFSVSLNGQGLRLFAFSGSAGGIPTDYVAAWPFSGNANDIGPSGYNGTVNGATLTTDKDGNANSAYDFDGTNDYIDFGDIDFSTFGTTISYSTWIYMDVLTSDRVLCQNTFNSDIANRFYIAKQNGGNFRVNIQNYNNSSINLSLSSATWYNLVITFEVNGSDQLEVEIFKDGVSTFTETSGVLTDPSSVCQESDHFVMGSLAAGTARFWDGKIFKTYIYDRILTQEEITELANE